MLEFKFWVTFALLLNCNLFFSQNWTKFDKIIASDRTSDDFFGREVAISGNYAIIGVSSSNTDSDGINPLNKSGLHIFMRKILMVIGWN